MKPEIWKVLDESNDWEVVDASSDEADSLMIGDLADCQREYPNALVVTEQELTS